MSDLEPRVSICLCTYKRPELLAQCLDAIKVQTLPPYEVVVVDNDRKASGRSVVDSRVQDFAGIGVKLKYLIEPVQNIALARNRSVKEADGDVVAFIDDDETPSVDWLRLMVGALRATDSAGVFGPVIAVFPTGFPVWMQRQELFGTSRFPSGSEVSRTSYATNNVLVWRTVLLEREGPFRQELGRTGGSDSDCFDWLTEKRGHRFTWCDEGTVFETQEPARAQIRWHLRRSYRHGWVHANKRLRLDGKSKGTLSTGLSVVLGTAKLLAVTVPRLAAPRVAMLLLVRGVASQIGKVGFFCGVKTEEYRER